MTKKEMFEKIAQVNSADEEIVEFCNKQIEALAKKASSVKPTKQQKENEGFKSTILDILAENDRPMTISEIVADERLAGLTNQRVSALMTQLKNAGVVVRTLDHKKAQFSINRSVESEDSAE